MEASDLSSGVWENETECTPVLVFTSLTRIANLVKIRECWVFHQKIHKGLLFFFFFRKIWCSPIFTKFAVCIREVKTNSGVHSVLSYHSPELRYECLSMLDLSLKYDIFATFTVVSFKCRWMQRFVPFMLSVWKSEEKLQFDDVWKHRSWAYTWLENIYIALRKSYCKPLNISIAKG